MLLLSSGRRITHARLLMVHTARQGRKQVLQTHRQRWKGRGAVPGAMKQAHYLCAAFQDGGHLLYHSALSVAAVVPVFPRAGHGHTVLCIRTPYGYIALRMPQVPQYLAQPPGYPGWMFQEAGLKHFTLCCCTTVANGATLASASRFARPTW